MSEEKSKRKARKDSLFNKLDRFLNEYKQILICGIDNVGSSQMQKIRLALRGKAALLNGKNTIMRKVIRQHIQNGQHPELEPLLGFIKGNVGLVFTNHQLNDIRKLVIENKVPAAAKSGTLAPVDVFIPPGPTGLDPGQTAFFQALNISTKIARGSIEIINEVHLIKKNDKVTSSHVSLLSKLNILPFFYGVTVQHVYEGGAVYPADVLDLTPEDVGAKFFAGVRKIAALSLAIGYPTIASLPTILGGGFRKLLAISFETNYEFKEAKAFKEAASKAPVAAAAAPAAAPKAGAAKAEAKKEAEKPKAAAPPPKEEEEEDMGFGASLFGD
jgi:large subunit ribosomal protein LP0